MTSTPSNSDAAAEAAGAAAVPMRFEATGLPVTDVDRAKPSSRRRV